VGNSDQEKVCRICGKSLIKRFHSGKYGKPPYYCSFKCNAIGERHKLLIVFFIFLILAIIFAIISYQQSTPIVILIILSIFIYSIPLIFLFNSLYGYIANNKRNARDEFQYHSVNKRPYQLKRSIITSYYPFNERDGEYRCTICKLKLNFSDECYQCSFCKSYFHNMNYGYNSNSDDMLILFKENMGNCTTKHGVVAKLAEEIAIPLYKKLGIYKLTEEITEGANEILEKYNIPFIPMVHCFLEYEKNRFDLTEGNNNGKKTSIEEFIHEEKVIPFISRKDEYLLFRKVLDEKIMLMPEIKSIEKRTLLKAREEGIKLLKENIK